MTACARRSGTPGRNSLRAPTLPIRHASFRCWKSCTTGDNRGTGWQSGMPGASFFFNPTRLTVRLHVGKESHLLRETMTAIEARLASRKFLRVSRSTIVNLERVVEWQPLFHGDSVVILRDGTRLTVSRVYRESFERLLAQLG
ncbi:MAG: LytTR family transcriptional regulator [Verrucomicrobia bacterium]|nr:MAG: LytTR family transcriptional regulator [Verrucomicrobiota bacterium]